MNKENNNTILKYIIFNPSIPSALKYFKKLILYFTLFEIVYSKYL